LFSRVLPPFFDFYFNIFSRMLERDFWCARPLRTKPFAFSRFFIEASFLRFEDRPATRRSPARHAGWTMRGRFCKSL
jgi:hypothetical protein